LALEDPNYRYWNDIKASDDLLDIVFERFFASLGHENIMRKTNYHRLAPFVKDIDAEVVEILDAIVAISVPPRALVS
jgi:hypothetical protein